MANVKIDGLSKYYGSNLAVNDISLDIKEGEFFSFLGPSGCGKSTTLRMIAGFEETEIGEIEVGGENVSALPPEARDIGFVFQNYAIFPHMNVYDNIAFGLRLRKMPEDELDTRVRAALAQVGMTGYENRFQREMSGGQQQRVALARVLVTEPRILLLDEPLSALDKNLREEMKFWIKNLQVSLGITTIYVTHDQGEALTMSDRIAVMHKGRISQVGTPREIYERPENRFVTEFIGESNILPCTVEAYDGSIATVIVGGATILSSSAHDLEKGEAGVLALRPEAVFVDVEETQSGWNCLKLPVKSITFQGALVRFEFDLNGHALVSEVANHHHTPNAKVGDELNVSWRVDAGRVLTD
ncbi:ABC transporter ATP-binding protein [Seohaeicola saemankumensis]|uniref:ABC transporter ATP-binding protein n=1 Tax=Seohaeicola saemankumensis TaxID=481181 RepID=UPI0035D0C7ED